MEQPTASDRMEELLAHRGWVQRVARALVQDESRADDLEQETWLRALRNPPPRPSRAWLGTVLRNTASSMGLAGKRRQTHEASGAPLRPRPSPQDLLERAEVVEQVARAVRTLEEPYRTAILLRYFEDLSPPAIASQLGVPLETVRTRLRRALARLREVMDRENRGERRKWALLLLPLARRPEPTTSGSAVAAGAAGAILMTLKAKATVAAVVLLVLAGGAVWMRMGEPTPGPSVPIRVAVSRDETRLPRRGGEEPATVPEAPSTSNPIPVAAKGATAFGRVVDDETGEPVTGASVRAVFNFARAGEEEKEPRAVTDRDGRFRLEGIDKRYQSADSLLVAADGFAEAEPSIYGWGAKANGGAPVDLGEFRLERGASVSGRVLDPAGRPVPGATILFCRDTPITSPPFFTPNLSKEKGRTDDEGRYTIARVPSAAGDSRHTVFAVSGTVVGWLTLPAVAGRKDLQGQDVRLAPTACIQVTVRAPNGRPAEESRVIAEPHFPPLGALNQDRPVHDLWIGRPEFKAILEGQGDPSGRVRLDRLPVAGESCRYDVVAYGKGLSRGWKDGVEVAPGETVEVIVDLNPVRSRTLSGTVRGPGGEPVVGAMVNFVGHRASTQADGTFRVDGGDPTELNFDPWMTVEAKGYATASRTFQRPAVWEGGSIDFVLERALPVRGRIVDESGNPVEGAQVTVVHGNFGVETAPSGADGRFLLKAGAERDARLTFMPPEPVTDWLVPDDAAVPAEGEEVAVVLRRAPRGARVVVEVLDANSGEALDPTEADAYPVDGTTMPRVYGTPPRIQGGRVTFERILPGDWVLWIGVAGRAPARVEVHVEKGQDAVRVRANCAPAGTVLGRVAGPGGTKMVFLSLVGVTSKPPWVRLNADPKFLDAANVEEDGSFRIEGVPPGRLRIWTETEGYRGETEVEVLSGTEVNADLQLVAQGRARFRPAGLPPRPAVLVRFAGAGAEWGRWSYFARRDESIPVWTTNVPLGRVRWQARFVDRGDGPFPDGPAAAEGEFESKVGETVEVHIPVR